MGGLLSVPSRVSSGGNLLDIRVCGRVRVMRRHCVVFHGLGLQDNEKKYEFLPTVGAKCNALKNLLKAILIK